MKTLFYSTKDFEEVYIRKATGNEIICEFLREPLSIQTTSKAKGFEAVCIFPGDDASAAVLERLHLNGVKYIAIRAAGYDNVDLSKARELNFGVANVPEYSPYAIAEHAVALLLALNRRIVTADR